MEQVIVERTQNTGSARPQGLFALLVALIPTKCLLKNCGTTPKWVEFITFGHAPIVHNIAAVLLFVCLFLLITFFSRRAKYKGKIGRSNFYLGISLGMLIVMPSVYFIGRKAPYQEIYWVEVIGLILFGIGWLVAGSYKDEPDKKLPKSAQIIKTFKVDASKKNYPTNITVEAGDRYYFKAKGCWNDSFLSCGPTGWGPSWNWWTSRNRLKGVPIFMLCGNLGMNVDNKKLAFSIGYEETWNVPEEVKKLSAKDRLLYLFANDWHNKYSNNSGFLEVTVYKIN